MKKRFFTIALLFGLSLGASAQEYFIGGDIGLNKFPNWADQADSAEYRAGAAYSSTSQSIFSVGLGIIAGQWVNQVYGWEVGYDNFGSVTGYTTAGSNYAYAIGNSYQFASTAYHAAVIFGSSRSLFGKVGIYDATTQLTIQSMTISPDKSSGIYFGIGGRYYSNDSEQFSFRIGLDIYPKVQFSELSDFTKSTSETITKLYLGEDYNF
jgi:hypothetical protein